MKMSFALRLVLVVLVMGMICGYLGMAWVNAADEYQAGKEQVGKTLAALQKATQQQPKQGARDIQARRDQVIAEIKKAESQYPDRIDEERMIRRLLEMAEGHHINVLSVANKEGSKKTEAYSYPLATLTLRVEGKYGDIVSFVFGVEGQRSGAEFEAVPALAMEDMKVNAVPNGYSGDLTFTVYGRPSALPKATPVKTSSGGSRPK